MSTHKVTLCMGSSCHSRGNRKLSQTLQEWVASEGLEEQIEIKGNLCLGKCKDGPIIQIDDKEYQIAEWIPLKTILERLIAQNNG